jgi:hypothetical protein
MPADQNSSDATTEPEEADTIELWISPEDRLLLEHAARESLAPAEPDVTAASDIAPIPARGIATVPAGDIATAPASAVATALAGAVASVPRSTASDSGGAWQKLCQKPRGVSTAIDLAIVITLIGLAYLMQYWLATPSGPLPQSRRVTAVQAANPVAPIEAAEAQTAPEDALPVYFRNPFDASEVFEFPPGTSQAEAREAVADLLLKRARERLSALGRLRGISPAHGQGAPAMTARNSADPPE